MGVALWEKLVRDAEWGRARVRRVLADGMPASIGGELKLPRGKGIKLVIRVRRGAPCRGAGQGPRS